MMAIDRDAPSVQLIRAPDHKHTDGDVADLVPAAGLEAVARPSISLMTLTPNVR